MRKILSLLVLCGSFTVMADQEVDQKGGAAPQQSASSKQAKPAKAKPQKKQAQKPVLKDVDTIVAVVYGKEDTIIITKSELNRRGLDGAIRTLDDLVLERLMYIDAKKHNMLPTEEDIDKHLLSVQKNYGLTLDQLKEMFVEAGYSYKEGREQFAITTAVQSIVDYKIMSRLIVPEKDVKAYYEAHPEVEQAAYHLQVAVVPFQEGVDPKDQKAQLEAIVTKKRSSDPLLPDGLSWSRPFWIDHQDVADDKVFIFSMATNDVSMPQETPSGFELIKLLDKKPERVRPLPDRYREIVNILRKPKYMSMLEEYKADLYANSSVEYFQ